MIAIDVLKGIGPKSAACFFEAGVRTCEELLFAYPKRYEDRSQVRTVEQLEDGVYATLDLELFQVGRLVYLPGKRTIQRTVWRDETGTIEIVWYNQPYIARTFSIGESYRVFGVYQSDQRRLTNPVVSTLPMEEFARIEPVYPSISGISASRRRMAVCQAMELVSFEELEYFDSSLRTFFSFSSLEDTIRQIHFPQSMQTLSLAKKQIRMRELFLQRLAGELLREKKKEQGATVLIEQDLSGFLQRLPFQLTVSQERVLKEIFSDLRSPYPMNRLVQGDVGSGKTVVALASAYIAIQNGCQAAMMAPTSVLAMQHEREARKIFEDLGISIYVLKGSESDEKRQDALLHAQQGTPGLWIGTHALFQKNVAFANLSLIITDEQHRFGVRQRKELAGKGNLPHSLVLSATPIPRTLALTKLGDLDLSCIDTKPFGRVPIQTYAVDMRYEQRICRFLQEHIAQGEQGYIVLPRIDEGEGEEYFSVEGFEKRWRKLLGSQIRMSILHGKLRNEEKEAILDRFSRGEIDLLISTTVVEVGVDVPNATVMIVGGAERFGLSQLHQLRGRVGRGHKSSHCILLVKTLTPSIKKRLHILEETEDGFLIAQHDLEMRGAGQTYGLAQHGIDNAAYHFLIDAAFVQEMDALWNAYFPGGADYERLDPKLREKVRKEIRRLDCIVMN